MKTAFVITVSDRASTGVYKDLSGELLAHGLIELGYEVTGRCTVKDDIPQITEALLSAVQLKTNLIITTGGTGVSPKDLTPEATRPLIKIDIPGFSEALREFSRSKTPTADLTRGVAGINGNSLIVNLPGSPNAVRDGLVIVKRLAQHIHDQLAGYDHN
jgi:molybdenum cofactor synthesis domain-containing protein